MHLGRLPGRARPSVTEAGLREKLVGKEKERYVNRLFGSIAPKYDLLNSIISLGRHKGWRRTAVRMSGLSPGGTALDIATGTGDFAVELARAAGAAGSVIGIDFCKPMLDLAERKLAGSPRVGLIAANVESLPFASGTFDCATIGFALRNVASVTATVAEMARATRSGGRVISLEIVGPRSRVLRPLWGLYLAGLMPQVARLFGAEREPYQYLPHSVARFYSQEELADIFRSCGLADIRVRNLMFGVVCIHMGTKQ
jgi:demethylmenaquinone methyltransferase/2-methoxy-6-polyprenyl-1,4-benzoquinol methylase